MVNFFKKRKNWEKEEEAGLGLSVWHSLADWWESSGKCKTVFYRQES